MDRIHPKSSQTIDYDILYLNRGEGRQQKLPLYLHNEKVATKRDRSVMKELVSYQINSHLQKTNCIFETFN